MGKKCCVPLCNSNYDKTKKDLLNNEENRASVYRFPKNEKEKELWVKAIPRANLVVKDDTVVCSKHWPPDASFTKVFGKLRPVDAPSIFLNIPKSCIPALPSKPRPTSQSLASKRNILGDELEKFSQIDSLSYETLISDINDKYNHVHA